ncbi:hypothetical protein NEPAR06_0237 [Nematocida parisii]|uniref:uncharacterized protein n=1 Tax=Nematocida parisii (strain ERTm1 / ATCC PRA-289) TaxID=881290 RepID=UPI000264B63D|nr:uncharacterized protein NEPG_00639 [Nematocida parisii ERTm1]EIJ95114.1 hypothetical protein NEPG_00639 [Nematocida parisii ERTm1]KAI5153159.1 hypothetical protein NEPAR06_0237 [Nematocida parisii]|eukprot:XP_013058470.1 hypothetical protein NEPG_00639 [Nematocida parisii ERTm1]
MLYSIPQQIKVTEYAMLIIGIICINIRLVQTSMELVNTSTLASAHAPQDHIHKGIISTIHGMDSTVGEREDSIRYANNMLEASIQKYGKNTATNSSTEQPKRNLKKIRQTRNAKSEHRYIIYKFNSNFKAITGMQLNDYLQYHWLETNNYYSISSYQTIVDSNYFEELVQDFVVVYYMGNNPNMHTESVNITRNNDKIINVPILSARVRDYYPFVKEDFKNMIKTHFKLKFASQKIDLFQKYDISEEQVAAMFLDMNKPPAMYKKQDFGDIARFNSSKDFINKIVDYSTPKTTKETLSRLKNIIDTSQVKLTMFIGGMFNEIEKFGMALPKFNVNKEYLDIVSADMPLLLDLKNSSEITTKLTISHLKNIWKFTNKCFIYQLFGVFKFIEHLSNIETPYGLKYLKGYLHSYKDEHINEGKEYFNKIYTIIENAKSRVSNVDVSNDNTYEINDEFEEIWYLVKSAMNLLNFATMSFKDKLGDLRGYAVLTNNIGLSNPLQNANNDFYNAADSDIESYVEYIWKITKYAVEHIGLTDEERGLDEMSYYMALIKELALSSPMHHMPSTTTDYILPTTTEKIPLPPTTTIKKATLTPTYISKAGQITFNMLLAVSAAGAYALQKIFFLR